MKFGSKSLLLLQLLAAFNPYLGQAAQSTLIGWGNGSSAPVTTAAVRMASCNGALCIAVMMDGTLLGWGNMGHNGENFNPPTVTNAKEVSCGNNACAVVLDDGTVLGWGEAGRGGNNPGITDGKYVACAVYWCLAIKTDGTIAHWGETSSSYISYGTYNGITGAVSASCGQACAILKDDGTVATYGISAGGADPTVNNSTPLVNIRSVHCDILNCSAITNDGVLISWGGSGPASNPAVTDAVQVDCDQWTGAAIRQGGTVVVWGMASKGGTDPGITNAAQIRCTRDWCAAVLTDGTLRQWPGTAPSATGMNRLSCGHGLCVAYNSDYVPGGGGEAGGGGDPHFFGFGGMFFTWQAHCDAILLKSPQENEDIDLEVHARMTRVRMWSKIDTIAFTSGNNLGEINSKDGILFLNGRETEELNDDSISVAKSKIKKNIHLFTLSFPEEKNLEVKVNTRTRMIYVNVSGRYPRGTQGLLGSPYNPGLISREGIMMSNKEVNAFGDSWQVKDTDRHLFSEERFPQHPSKCLYDIKKIKRLTRRSRALKELHQISREEATNACKFHRLAPMRQFCIYDVMLTGDIETAKDDFYG